MSQVRYFFLAIVSRLDLDAVPNLSPPDQAPMLFDSPTERNLFVDRSADRRRQADLGQIGLDGNDASAGGKRADVHHQSFRSWKASKLWRPSCRPPFEHRKVGEAKKVTKINKQQTLSVYMIRFNS
jgi:hypothetical protein